MTQVHTKRVPSNKIRHKKKAVVPHYNKNVIVTKN